MTANKDLLQSEIFYVDHLGANEDLDHADVRNFFVEAAEGQGLSEYLKNYADKEETWHSMRTYLVRDNETDECVGYFSLKAGLISLNEMEVEVESSDTGERQTVREFDTDLYFCPAV